MDTIWQEMYEVVYAAMREIDMSMNVAHRAATAAALAVRDAIGEDAEDVAMNATIRGLLMQRDYDPRTGLLTYVEPHST